MPKADLIFFPFSDEEKKEKEEEIITHNKLLDKLGRVNLFDESVAPPIWVCYYYGENRIQRDCSIYRTNGTIFCNVEDIDKHEGSRALISQILEGDEVELREDGDYTIGVFWHNKKLGNVEARNVPAVAICMSGNTSIVKVGKVDIDRAELYIKVPATFDRVNDPILEKKYGPYSFLVKIVKKNPWKEYKFECPKNRFKEIFYYDNPADKKFTKEELLAQQLPSLEDLDCPNETKLFAEDFLNFLRTLGNIQLIEVHYFPFNKTARLDFYEEDECFNFESHKDEIDNYLKESPYQFNYYQFEYNSISIQFQL